MKRFGALAERLHQFVGRALALAPAFLPDPVDRLPPARGRRRKRFVRRRAITALCLAGILAGFLIHLAWLRPADFFGQYHDDTVYYGSAQALAQGRGNIIPSLPGTPPMTKNPALYPWLLSWVWKWQPEFPANVAGAVWMTALFGAWFLIAAYVFLRRLEGVGRGPAMALTGLSAFHPFFLYFSGSVLTDIPFAALALTAILLAQPAVERRARTLLILAGVLAGLSTGLRTVGVMVVASIAAWALYRRAWRQAVWFGLAAAPLSVAALIVSGVHAAPPAWAAGGSHVWRQTWAFYTSYADFWKLSVPGPDVFWAMISVNLREFLETPSTYCLFPPPGGSASYAGVLLSITLTAGILAGIVRQARRQGWGPLHFLFPLYSVPVLVWSQSQLDRFLILFLPLFYAGLWVEGAHLASMLSHNLRSPRRAAEKALAGALALALVALTALAANHYLADFRPRLRVLATQRAALEAEKQQLWSWIRTNTPADTRFVAHEDVSLYLYTGRQAMRPIVFSAGAFYLKDDAILKRDLAQITDVARRIGARYWVSSADDSFIRAAGPLAEKRVAQIEAALPLVFQTREGHVRLYDLACLHRPDRAECRSAAAALLPPGDST